ncbi:MAG: tetratricopeptide repeat protein [Spirosomataceae bacterium]
MLFGSRFFWVSLSLLQAPAVALGQMEILWSAKTTYSVQELSARKVPEERFHEIDYVPYFGYKPKSLERQVEDLHFISSCEKTFGNRAEASHFFSQMGWDYLSEGQRAMATQRFNLAWMLDAHNADAWWGLGVIEFQSANLPGAIQSLRKAAQLLPHHQTLQTDLATLLMEKFQADGEVNGLLEARSILEKTVQEHPEFVFGYMKLASAHLYSGDLQKAWDTFHQGHARQPNEIDLQILEKLLQHSPDPLNIFKLQH